MISAHQILSRHGIRTASAEPAGQRAPLQEWPPAFKASRTRAISAGWWLVPSILVGLLLWVMAFRAVFFWLAG